MMILLTFIDIQKLLSLHRVDFIVISLPYEYEGLTNTTLEILTRRGTHVLLCRDMDICYDVCIDYHH